MKKGKMVPAKQFASLAGVPYTTLMDWLKAGRVKGARFVEAPTPTGGYWLIPESAAEGLERPKIGRPRKVKPAVKGQRPPDRA